MTMQAEHENAFLISVIFFAYTWPWNWENCVSQVQYHCIHNTKIFPIYNLRKFLWIIHKLTKLLSGKRGYFNQSHIDVQPSSSNWLLFMGSEVLRLPYCVVFWHRVVWEQRNTKKIPAKNIIEKCIYWSKMQYVCSGFPSWRIMWIPIEKYIDHKI